jgi:hypothetical protein
MNTTAPASAPTHQVSPVSPVGETSSPAPQSAPAASPALAEIETKLKALIGQRVTVHVWLRFAFIHISSPLQSTGPGYFHVNATDWESRDNGKEADQAGMVFGPVDVDTIDAFPDARARITLKTEPRA